MKSLIGQPATRQDARLKVTGSAKYSAEFALPNMAYAVLVTSPVGRGTIRSIDTAAARAATGVLKIITHEDKPQLRDLDPKAMAKAKAQTGEGLLPFQSPDIVYNGQAIAVVVADTYERARYAASLVKAEIDSLPPSTTLHDTPNIDTPKSVHGSSAQIVRDAPDAAFDGATRKIEATYHTTNEHHNPLEPHAQIAHFHDGGLTVYQSTQGTTPPQTTLAYLFDLPPEKVRCINYFTGGGFGCKGTGAWAHDIACVIAARAVGRPVKLALMRQQMFAGVGHRGETEMSMQIAAKPGGEMEMLAMKTLTQGHQDQQGFFETAGLISNVMYPAPNYEMAHRVARNNVSPPIYMRAPGEASGAFGLECAMDEMAHELGLDPIAFRLSNYAKVDPDSKLPFSSKQLSECYARGAKMIGWDARSQQPRARREGRYLIGYGMASATYPANRQPAAAQCRVYADGRAVAGSAGVDIGTGAYTVFRQVAADTLGFPLYKVVFELGDSKLPYAPVAGGSWLTASVAPAVVEACEMVMRDIAQIALKDRRSPLFGRKLDEIEFRDGLAILKSGGKGEALADIVKRSGKPFVEACCRAETMASAKGSEGLKQKRRAPCAIIDPDAQTDHDDEKYSFHSFGAQFCKLRVDEELGTIRLLDWAAVIDAGRILNLRTARSQILGGVGFGIGMALSEETLYDPPTGRPVIRNLADYHVAVNADMPNIQVDFVQVPDPHINSLGCRGIGEIGIVGVPAAIANAVFNATGKRLRDLPLTPDKFV